jgi:hypothetical protein
MARWLPRFRPILLLKDLRSLIFNISGWSFREVQIIRMPSDDVCEVMLSTVVFAAEIRGPSDLFGQLRLSGEEFPDTSCKGFGGGFHVVLYIFKNDSATCAS